MRRLNWQKILTDTYIELYKNSEPQANFNELVSNATINERGEKVIPFMDYEISGTLMDSIVESFIKRYKMKDRDASGYKFSIYLGCSPKTKRYD